MKRYEFQHPWQQGPSELVQYALEHVHKPSDFDQRIAFLLLDIGVETICKTFLELSEGSTGAKIGYGERKKAAEGSFHELIQGTSRAAGNRLKEINLEHAMFYHDIRNKLYHKGNGITVPSENTKAYAKLAVELLFRLLGVDLREVLIAPDRIEAEESEILCLLEEIKGASEEELKQFYAALPLLMEQVEPQVLFPSFMRQFAVWCSTLERLSTARQTQIDIVEYMNTIDYIYSSAPVSIKWFIEKYLDLKSYTGPLSEYNGVPLPPGVVYDPIPASYLWLIAQHSNFQTLFSESDDHLPILSLTSLAQDVYCFVAQKTSSVFAGLQYELGTIEMYLLPPYLQEDTLASLQTWLKGRQEGLQTLKEYNRELAQLVLEYGQGGGAGIHM